MFELFFQVGQTAEKSGTFAEAAIFGLSKDSKDFRLLRFGES